MKSQRIEGVGTFSPDELTPAGLLRPGDCVMWNAGNVSKVLAIEEASPKYVLATMLTESGEVLPRRMKKTRGVVLVECAEHGR